MNEFRPQFEVREAEGLTSAPFEVCRHMQNMTHTWAVTPAELAELAEVIDRWRAQQRGA